MIEIAIKLFFWAPPLLVAVILHEIAHGYIAYKLGDPTAKSMGRLSLNPIRHIDPVMTIILPGLLILGNSPVIFGGAKPVPVNPGYFKSPRRGMMWVALAGPVTNFILMAIAFILLKGLQLYHPVGWEGKLFSEIAETWLVYSIITNLVLALFNLIPVPPLDGGRIAVGLLPTKLAMPLAKLEPYGLFILFAMLYFHVVDEILAPVITTILGYLFSHVGP